ncbi:RagB/SusD family nutrient uptake outer membrane protein [Mucilaginibacter lacusdianchii]|uniref:RagB/SusD family nutrient uptake outer membrane protein n=1 Tax=Mucilaginibacter lacusdianchii TaxID=2684211 RepID=UPI00131E86C2|nr:RagB/SusD family nutrient uptake outer membrane protein [Mucilaginibacter sp. JXJ CY 39]
MKYRYHKITLLSLLLLIATTACKKSFLEVIPKGRLVAQTASEYSLLLSNLDLLNMGAANVQVPMGDEVAAIEPYFTTGVSASLKSQRSFRWDATIYEPNEDAGETLVPLRNIYLYNKVITEVPNATDGSAQLKLQIESEARAGRAWAYFLLINYYGKPYNAATAATDPGFPIVEVADVTTTKFERATVQQVYNFIINDLTTAIPNLNNQVVNRTRMSKAAAEAILGKVYTFMGRYNDALPMLNAAIADLANQATPVKIYDYNVEFATGGVFLPINATSGPASILLPNNAESLYSKQFANGFTSSYNEIVITPQTAALFGPTDQRLKFYSNSTYSTKLPFPVAGVLRKQKGSQTLFGVQLPDLYLLRAECRCRTNDLTGAKADVEALRTKRMPATDATVPSAIENQQLALLNFILDERIREYAVEGYRWFDMRRLSVDPLFASKTYTHTLYSATGAATTFQLKPERFTLKLPQKIIDQNPNIENNP